MFTLSNAKESFSSGDDGSKLPALKMEILQQEEYSSFCKSLCLQQQRQLRITAHCALSSNSHLTLNAQYAHGRVHVLDFNVMDANVLDL